MKVASLREPSGPSHPDVHFLGSPLRPRTYRNLSRIVQDSDGDAIVLLQYSAMYGFRGTNLLLAFWLRRPLERRLWVMFHELYLAYVSQPQWKHHVLRWITRRVCRFAAQRADRCFASTNGYAEILRGVVRSSVPVEPLPVPSNLPAPCNPDAVRALRMRLQAGGCGPLIGHFGTYPPAHRSILREFVGKAASRFPHWRFVFIGRDSRHFVGELHNDGALASGELGPEEASCWISACDLMLQPYADGVSTRNGSLMAALALGKATVTNFGVLSDPLWRHAPFLSVVGEADADKFLMATEKILADREYRQRLETDSLSFYERNFDLRHTIARLETAGLELNLTALHSPIHPGFPEMRRRRS